MYGKAFASMYTGSMIGKGSHVFAVWGWIIANKDKNGLVEINSVLLAAVLGESEDRVKAAIDVLSSPDPLSRTKVEDGRRILREGQFLYRVVNNEKYNLIRSKEDRNAYMRQYMADRRNPEGVDKVNSDANKVNSKQSLAMLAHVDVDKDKDKDKKELKERKKVAGGLDDPERQARAATDPLFQRLMDTGKLSKLNPISWQNLKRGFPNVKPEEVVKLTEQYVGQPDVVIADPFKLVQGYFMRLSTQADKEAQAKAEANKGMPKMHTDEEFRKLVGVPLDAELPPLLVQPSFVGQE